MQEAPQSGHRNLGSTGPNLAEVLAATTGEKLPAPPLPPPTERTGLWRNYALEPRPETNPRSAPLSD
eukprot:6730322-Lingulodinium_polyedra.AAC.1